MLASSPLNPMAFQTPIPQVTLTDLRSDTSDLTTYTFTACQINIHGTLWYDNPADSAYVRTNKNVILVAVHAEDAAQTFGPNSVTIGGVAGSEAYDRGGAGAGVLVDTAVWHFTTESLQNITNTDIAVTFSEAVTGCSIAVISLSNIAIFARTLGGGADVTGTGTLTVANPATATNPTGVHGFCFVFSTINAAGETLAFEATVPGGTGMVAQPILLYEGSNAEFGYAGAYTYTTQLTETTTPVVTWTLSWSGAANADAIAPTAIRI